LNRTHPRFFFVGGNFFATERSSVPQFQTDRQLRSLTIVTELTGAQTYSLCLLINMIKYPGISDTEVRNDLEWLPGVQLGTNQELQADIPYKLLIVHLGHDDYK